MKVGIDILIDPFCPVKRRVKDNAPYPHTKKNRHFCRFFGRIAAQELLTLAF